MITFVYRFLPAIVLYTDKGIPERFAGYTRGIVVRIRPEYRNDKGLLMHELTHVKQNYRSFFLHSFLLLCSKLPREGRFIPLRRCGEELKLKREIEAYAVQLLYTSGYKYDYLLERFTTFIYTRYGLTFFRYKEIKQRLQKEIDRITKIRLVRV